MLARIALMSMLFPTLQLLSGASPEWSMHSSCLVQVILRLPLVTSVVRVKFCTSIRSFVLQWYCAC